MGGAGEVSGYHQQKARHRAVEDKQKVDAEYWRRQELDWPKDDLDTQKRLTTSWMDAQKPLEMDMYMNPPPARKESPAQKQKPKAALPQVQVVIRGNPCLDRRLKCAQRCNEKYNCSAIQPQPAANDDVN